MYLNNLISDFYLPVLNLYDKFSSNAFKRQIFKGHLCYYLMIIPEFASPMLPQHCECDNYLS